MKESLPLTLYNCANVDSTNELAAPNRAMTPHPEHCSRPAYSDGSGHTRQIARTYTAGNGDGKCLE